MCAECSSDFVTNFGEHKTIYCSTQCAERYNKKRERAIYGNKYSKENKKRRAQQIKENYVAPVEYQEIYKRDKGICQICGTPVLNNIDRNNTWGGTVDHIIPLSKDGTHEPQNCQLAHRICNSIKSDLSEATIDWEQMSKESNY